MDEKEEIMEQEEEKEAQEEFEDSQNLAKEQVPEDETADEMREYMEGGEAEENVYSETGREKLVEDDEISPLEEGFSEGAEQKGELGNCAHCGKPLGEDRETLVERKFDGEIKWFCSDECANAGPKKEISEE